MRQKMEVSIEGGDLKYVRVERRELVRGALIRNTNCTPNFINVVHRVEKVNNPHSAIRIFSTRFAELVGGKLKILTGTRARPFEIRDIFWNYNSWEEVRLIRVITQPVYQADLISAALDRSYTLYEDAEDEDNDEDSSTD